MPSSTKATRVLWRSTMIFDPFKSTRPITWVHITSPGHVDAGTGQFVPEETARSQITGSLHDGDRITSTSGLPAAPASQAQSAESLIDLGSKSIHTSTLLSVNDRIELTEANGTVSVWEITGLIRSYDLLKRQMGIDWYSFALKSVSPPSSTQPATDTTGAPVW